MPAQGQGTMNNVTLGNDRFTYYETIGGGQGACPDADGPSGVHVAMSNTLNTPVEALELAYPLRVERYALRLGSGGRGARGGDGVVRELRVLEDCRVSIISERRPPRPSGERGGGDAATGRNLVNGEEVPAKETRELEAGDVVRSRRPAAAAGVSRLFSMGEVVAIYIGLERQLPQPVESAEAHRRQGPGRQPLLLGRRLGTRGERATLIAEEALDAFHDESGIELIGAGEPAERPHARAST